MPNLVRLDVADRIATVTLDDPAKRNAFSPAMVEALHDAFERVAADDSVRAVIVTGAGSAFCAGADLGYLRELQGFDVLQNQADSRRLMELFRRIHLLPKPVVAAINGPALGGGAGLASVCDFVLAGAERAKIGYTEVRIGFIPAVVSVFLARRIGLGAAREVLLSGAILTADEAYRLGLVNRVVADDGLMDAARTVAGDWISQNSGQALALTKELLAAIPTMGLDEALDYAVNLNVLARLTPDCKTGIQRFLDKTPQIW